MITGQYKLINLKGQSLNIMEQEILNHMITPIQHEPKKFQKM